MGKQVTSNEGIKTCLRLNERLSQADIWGRALQAMERTSTKALRWKVFGMSTDSKGSWVEQQCEWVGVGDKDRESGREKNRNPLMRGVWNKVSQLDFILSELGETNRLI